MLFNIIPDWNPLTIGTIDYGPVIKMVLLNTLTLSYTQEIWKDLCVESAWKHYRVLLVTKYLLLLAIESLYKLPILHPGHPLLLTHLMYNRSFV